MSQDEFWKAVDRMQPQKKRRKKNFQSTQELLNDIATDSTTDSTSDNLEPSKGPSPATMKRRHTAIKNNMNFANDEQSTSAHNQPSIPSNHKRKAHLQIAPVKNSHSIPIYNFTRSLIGSKTAKSQDVEKRIRKHMCWLSPCRELNACLVGQLLEEL